MAVNSRDAFDKERSYVFILFPPFIYVFIYFLPLKKPYIHIVLILYMKHYVRRHILYISFYLTIQKIFIEYKLCARHILYPYSMAFCSFYPYLMIFYPYDIDRK